jgi:ornithine--oxo-acid transaminase
MDRAVVHGSTFAKNDLAMVAGLATLHVLDEERLIERADALGKKLLADLQAALGGLEFVREVRGLGLMIAIEFGTPRSLKLKAAWSLMEQASRGLYCQLVLIPLLEKHRILAQVAGHALPVIKLLPAYVIDEGDVAWIVRAFSEVIRDSQRMGGVWGLGRTLASHAMKARAGAA